LLMVFLSVTAIMLAVFKPGLAPKTFSVPWKERVGSLKGVWPIMVVMLSIIGIIYTGIATPTETAGVGVVVCLAIAVFAFKMRWKGLAAALKEAATVNGLILFIIIAATYFTYVVGSTNVATLLQNLVGGSGVSPWMVILGINIILLILGCLIDPITITLLTVPIFLPVVVALGFDPIWFGVIFCVNTQIGLITPPMGTDLFAVKTIFNIPTMELLKGVIPFLAAELVFLAVLCFWPQISLWLPNLMIAK
jgi:C4-dicarboxylate transporter DctM subunit